MTLSTIRGNSESINSRFAPSLNAAFAELEQHFGFSARALSPLGGARTKEQCVSLGLSWSLSDHWEGSSKAAVDIDNHRAFRNADQAAFLRILAKYGWHNIQINGRPFPSEPWHFANHDANPWQPASRPAGSTGVDITPEAPQPEPEYEMSGRYIVRDTDGSQAVIGDLFWNDYGIGTRAEIAARTVAPHQVGADGIAVPERVSAHEWAISWEEFNTRFNTYRLRLGMTSSAIDANAIASQVTAAIKALPLQALATLDPLTIAEIANASAAATIREIAN